MNIEFILYQANKSLMIREIGEIYIVVKKEKIVLFVDSKIMLQKKIDSLHLQIKNLQKT